MGSLFSSHRVKRVLPQPSLQDSVLGDEENLSARSSQGAQPLSDRAASERKVDSVAVSSRSSKSSKKYFVASPAPPAKKNSKSSNNNTPRQNSQREHKSRAGTPIVSPFSDSLISPSPDNFESPGVPSRVAVAVLANPGEFPAEEENTSIIGAPLNDNYYDEDERLSLEKVPTFHTAANAEFSPILNWRKGDLLGFGAFGQVFLGLNIDNGELVAVKEVPVLSSANSRQSEIALLALEKEIGLMAALKHSNIVRYLGTQRTNSALNIFMEFVPGGSIASLLKRFGKFNEVLIRVYCKQILQGLEYLHSHSIIHRDIKGGNLLVGSDSTIKLGDFGAATRLANLSGENCGPKSLVGSPYWMAPEVVKQTGHGRQADIWSVGCTIIEMATGKPPWTEFNSPFTTMMHIASTNELPPLPDHLSEEARHFLICCLQRDPKARPNATRLLNHPFITGQSLESNLTDSIDLTGLLKEVYEREIENQSKIEVLREASASNANSPRGEKAAAEGNFSSSFPLRQVVGNTGNSAALQSFPGSSIVAVARVESSDSSANSLEENKIAEMLEKEKAAASLGLPQPQSARVLVTRDARTNSAPGSPLDPSSPINSAAQAASSPPPISVSPVVPSTAARFPLTPLSPSLPLPVVFNSSGSGKFPPNDRYKKSPFEGSEELQSGRLALNEFSDDEETSNSALEFEASALNALSRDPLNVPNRLVNSSSFSDFPSPTEPLAASRRFSGLPDTPTAKKFSDSPRQAEMQKSKIKITRNNKMGGNSNE